METITKNASFISISISTMHKHRMRGDTYMTSALRGGGGVAQYVTNTTDRLHECVTKGGEGPKF